MPLRPWKATYSPCRLPRSRRDTCQPVADGGCTAADRCPDGPGAAVGAVAVFRTMSAAVAPAVAGAVTETGVPTGATAAVSTSRAVRLRATTKGMRLSADWW